MLLNNLQEAEAFVTQQVSVGNDVRWDGWDIVSFSPNDRAVYSRTGAFRNGTWGYERRSTVNDKGFWYIHE